MDVMRRKFSSNTPHEVSASKVIWLSGEQVSDLLSYEACIEILEEAMPKVSRGDALMPLRHGMPLLDKGLFGMMPGALTGQPGVFGIKLLSLYPENPAKGLPSHLGLFVLFNFEDGLPIAVLNAGALTAIRTAAASALATKYLSRKDAHILTIIGTGEQAGTHIEAISMVRDIREIRIWGRNVKQAEKLASEYAGSVRGNFLVEEKIEHAIKGADIICTVTAASNPILAGKWLEPGMHLNVVGSGVPDKAEVDAECIRRSRVFVDSKSTALALAGDLRRPIESGDVCEGDIIGEIGEVILGGKHGRISDEDISLYKSVGVIAQDLSAAWWIFEEAARRNIGSVVTL
ncbi:MAG: ornithine cyclodeaminase family protein [Caulobacterales bacterium]|nr:ornithine cyclodeaminase family protein [Caulobacterales bacterium]